MTFQTGSKPPSAYYVSFCQKTWFRDIGEDSIQKAGFSNGRAKPQLLGSVDI